LGRVKLDQVVLESWAVLTVALVEAVVGVELVLAQVALAQVALAQVEALLLYLLQP
jgi:hypothetical protein